MMIKQIKNAIYQLGGQMGKEYLTLLKSLFFNLRYVSQLKPAKAKKKNVFYFLFDPKFSHPGLADRFKAIVGCYHIAKQNGYDFKIVWDTPYLLSDFLVPNQIDWRANKNDITYSLIDTRFFVYTGKRKGVQHRLSPQKQYVCCSYKGDDLFYVNGNTDYPKAFFMLYNELFQPSDHLNAVLEETGLQPRGYISIHVRFVNALETFEDSKYPTLSPEAQANLMKRCRAAILKVIETSALPVVLFSDSQKFLTHMKDLPLIILNSENIAHISNSSSNDSIMKTFLDFYLISRSKTVYRMIAKELYATNFSLYASFMGNAEEIELYV
ncbi:MAG: hypothetical protein SOX84_02665 [Prevotella sp.]|nr:hypothetical protein [Prevotella sp.]